MIDKEKEHMFNNLGIFIKHGEKHRLIFYKDDIEIEYNQNFFSLYSKTFLLSDILRLFRESRIIGKVDDTLRDTYEKVGIKVTEHDIIIKQQNVKRVELSDKKKEIRKNLSE